MILLMWHDRSILMCPNYMYENFKDAYIENLNHLFSTQTYVLMPLFVIFYVVLELNLTSVTVVFMSIC
jgi:hypothetical protein